jgi:hypothetical protein
MKSCLTKILLGAAFIMLANAGLSYGDSIALSNLTDVVNGTGTIYSSGPPQSYAQEFLTGSSSLALSSVTVVLGDASGTFTASADLVNNNSGLPGNTVLTVFTVPAIRTSSPANLTLAPASSVTLQANTDYWFVLSASGSGDFQWDYTSTLSSSFPNYAASSDGGATWAVGTPAGPFLFAANTPEPSSLLLGAIGLLAFGTVVCVRRLRTSE